MLLSDLNKQFQKCYLLFLLFFVKENGNIRLPVSVVQKHGHAD